MSPDRVMYSPYPCAGSAPRSDGQSGLRVVRVLEAAQAALDRTRRERHAVV